VFVMPVCLSVHPFVFVMTLYVVTHFMLRMNDVWCMTSRKLATEIAVTFSLASL
jgi:hypothetical protein